MGSKKIIVPQGLINPNETTIIEIPAGVDSEATLIARSSPRCGDPEFVPNMGSTPCTSRRITTAPASPRGAGGSGGGGGGQKTVRKITSSTVITDDDSSFGILSPGTMNTTDHSSLGILPGAHFDSSRNTTSSSFGIMPGSHFDNSRNTTDSLGLLPGAHFDYSRNTTPSSFGSPGSHFDNNRNTSPSCSVRSPVNHGENRNANQSCSPRGAAGGSGGGGGGGQRTVRKVTSTTVISDNDSSLGVLSPGTMNTTDDSSFGLLPGGHFDHSRNTTQSSLGLLPGAQFDYSRNTTQSSLGLMPGVHFDNSRNTTQSSLGLLPGAHFDQSRNTTQQSSLGILDSRFIDLNASNIASPSSMRRRVRTPPGNANNEYYDNTRSTDPSSLGILSPGCMDSGRSTGNNSPRRVKKIIKKVVTESPKSPNENAISSPYNGQQFHSNKCPGASPPPSPPIDSNRQVTTVTSETIMDEGEGEESSLGILGQGFFDSTRSSGSLGILGSGYMDSTQESCGSNPNSNCPSHARSEEQGSNLTSEVQRHLRELEQTERTQINRDLAMFQQARRRLVQDATNISSSGDSQVQFKKP